MDFEANRTVMKSNFRMLQEIQTDQEKQLPQPSLEKPYSPDETLILLPEVDGTIGSQKDMYTCLKQRRSVRKYEAESLTLAELSYLLWATQGVQRIFGKNYATFRPAPSGGARHSFETYLAVNRVTGLTNGVYRYLPLEHQLLWMFPIADYPGTMTKLALNQPFVGNGAVVFFWSCLPYRGEWRYHMAAHKTMLLDAGHLCQNLYLACESIDCGTCAIGAYDQEGLDQFLQLDEAEEFVVYMAPVGRKK